MQRSTAYVRYGLRTTKEKQASYLDARSCEILNHRSDTWCLGKHDSRAKVTFPVRVGYIMELADPSAA